MSQTIYNMTYEKVQKSGHFLSFTHIEDKRLNESEVAHLEMRMMESNQIPHLLSLSSEEMDFNIRLQYDITSKKTLKDLLLNQSISSFEFYQLFIKIITVLEQSKLYMLNEDKYMINQDFLYLGKDLNELYLIYLPVNSLDKKVTTVEEIKILIEQAAKKTQGLQGSELKNIKQYLQNPSFSLIGLKELLMELQNLRHRPEASYSPYAYSDEGDLNEQVAGHSPQGMNHMPGQQPAPKEEKPNENKENTKKSQDKKKKKSRIAQIPPLTQRQKVYVFAGGLLTLTAVWKMYEWIPIGWMFLTGLALTGIILVSMVYFMFLHSKVVENVRANQEVAATSESTIDRNKHRNQDNHQALAAKPPVREPHSHAMNGWQQEEYAQPQQRVTYQNEESFEKSRVMSVNIEESKEDVDDTTFLAEEEDTVFLGDDEDEAVESKAIPLPRFEFEKDGERKQVTINKSHFLVGRNPSSVDYVEESVGVSRAHLEFIKIDDQYGIKDLGSKNGTKLNEQPLVPYKIYSLDPGDTITLGKIEYTFHWE
ncbi:DUF6382 domain-containing protein [Evansella halocellulosilytica]|uniref:DUF6382 domain-containing protein n=1 Tax=Evansella halocellulosilytica TaxID=2011013 RepID=UPI000BB7E710|nr:DUF6382 domain-containing protein [Evansella halocellulosilytica]